MLKSILMAGVAASALFATRTAAQDALDLGTIVLSPSLSPVDAGRSAASVELILDPELDTRDASLRDALARAPGVSYSANGGTGAVTNVRIRGLGSPYVGVRLDGIDISDPTSTQTGYDFGALASNGLARAEVLKGSQSALYGSEAIGGVIDLTTWRPERDGASAQLRFEGGSFGTRSATASAGYLDDRTEIAMTLGRVATDGISARPGDDEKDGFDSSTAIFFARTQATDTLGIGVNGFVTSGSVELDRSATDNSGENSFDQRGARVFADVVTGGFTHTLSLSTFDTKRRDPGGFVTAFDGSRREAEYRVGGTLGDTVALDFGASRTIEEAETSGAALERDTVASLFGEARWSPRAGLDLNLALRRDDNSDFGVKTTGRVGLAYALPGDTILRAQLATGYRAPSLFERYSTAGDPTLQPETSRSAELGIEKRLASGSIEATLFYTEIEDLVGFDGAATACGSGFGCYNQVPGLTVSEGLELGAEYALSETLTLSGSYTFTNAENGGAPLPRVPRHDLVLGVDAVFSDRWSGFAEIQHLADIEPSAFAPADNKVGDHTLVNLGVSYDFTDARSAYLRVENALDEDYETAGGFNTAGRAVYFGVRASF